MCIRDRYEGMARQLQLLRWAISKVVHKKMSAAWVSWRELVWSALQLQRTMAQCKILHEQTQLASACRHWHGRCVYRRWAKRIGKQTYSVPDFLLAMPPNEPGPGNPEYKLLSWTRYRNEYHITALGLHVPVYLLTKPRTKQPFEQPFESSDEGSTGAAWSGELMMEARERRQAETAARISRWTDWPRVPVGCAGEKVWLSQVSEVASRVPAGHNTTVSVVRQRPRVLRTLSGED
eukprot:TRINITY_DN38233_c0_g1_i1.p1 TRINITY_DN38233_c0_g1~~TRINITY_DN38233_c0_g1_i1.p1  ORF type:complete len:235 (-),score=25.95 TRINITY_DN38233_c0_g1_i1:89-793(-)